MHCAIYTCLFKQHLRTIAFFIIFPYFVDPDVHLIGAQANGSKYVWQSTGKVAFFNSTDVPHSQSELCVAANSSGLFAVDCTLPNRYMCQMGEHGFYIDQCDIILCHGNIPISPYYFSMPNFEIANFKIWKLVNKSLT